MYDSFLRAASTSSLHPFAPCTAPARQKLTASTKPSITVICTPAFLYSLPSRTVVERGTLLKNALQRLPLCGIKTLMAIILYGNRLSPFVEKVHRGLMLKQIPFQQHEPHGPFDLRRNNPT